MDGYDVGQVCINGHIVNSHVFGEPQHNQDRCTKCGAKTIITCVSCEERIRGFYNEGWGSRSMTLPSYCHKCGVPYPWTASSLEAAKELISESNLSAEEQEQLGKTLPDLVAETPKTQVAVARYKRLIEKAGNLTADGLQKILVTIVSEAIKTQMFGV
jgi:hypothetical protein